MSENVGRPETAEEYRRKAAECLRDVHEWALLARTRTGTTGAPTSASRVAAPLRHLAAATLASSPAWRPARLSPASASRWVTTPFLPDCRLRWGSPTAGSATRAKVDLRHAPPPPVGRWPLEQQPRRPAPRPERGHDHPRRGAACSGRGSRPGSWPMTPVAPTAASTGASRSPTSTGGSPPTPSRPATSTPSVPSRRRAQRLDRHRPPLWPERRPSTRLARHRSAGVSGRPVRVRRQPGPRQCRRAVHGSSDGGRIGCTARTHRPAGSVTTMWAWRSVCWTTSVVGPSRPPPSTGCTAMLPERQ
jgi:hypothetical protein